MGISRASTATLARERTSVPEPESVPGSLLNDAAPCSQAKRLIIAVDFGTTFSAVSYVALETGEDSRYIEPDRIQSIQNYPDDKNFGVAGDMRSEVPTQVVYPPKKKLMRQVRQREQDGTFDNHQEEEEEEEDEGNEAEQNPFVAYTVEEADMGEQTLADGDGLSIFGTRDESDDDAMSIDEPASFEWGYSVYDAWGMAATHTADPTNLVLSRFKLLLDNSPMTNGIRASLEPTIAELKRRKIIENPHHVIVDYLTCLLRHTMTQLREAGFDEESYHTEMVLCVPAIWTQKACRDMQSALAKAMDLAGFRNVDDKNSWIENLFIVSEPEAAAAYVLAYDRHIGLGDTFVLMDAGGGTIDAITYTTTKSDPLRLVREEVDPGGGLYGSSYLNEGFHELLHRLLDDETYLESGENTINGIIEEIMINLFEYRLKRTFDCYRAKGRLAFTIPGLRDNPEKGFKGGKVAIPVERIQEIFLERLRGIGGIMENQLNAATDKGVVVEYVVLIGGFAGSVSLEKYLRQRLSDYCKRRSLHPIELIRPKENTATAVALGAVLRACNKEEGPRRRARSSYGIQRAEPYMDFPEHDGIKPTRDSHDGLSYIKGTVDWVLKLGDEVPAAWTCEPLLCSHTFNVTAKRFLCREILYVSDRATESHYQLKHAKNRGAEKAGEIVVDFSYLRDENLIQPVYEIDDRGRHIGTKHYRVNYTLVIKVVDRDLQCYAIYGGEVKQKCRLNIAPAFRPGVK